MNIFVLDEDPVAAARMQCDRHVVKMPVEAGQMLVTVLAQHGAHVGSWKSTHAKHPCTLWAGETRANFEWLCEHAFALVEEHGRRYPHTAAGRRGHKAGPVILDALDHAHRLPAGPLTPHVQAMPERWRVPGNPVAGYRQYYAADKAHFASWRAPGAPPAWWPHTPA